MQRIFIGIPVDKQTQRTINELIGPIRKLSLDVRWVPENNRHLTLSFLGNISISRVEKLLGLFDETYQPLRHFQFRLTKLTRFPDSTGGIIALVDKPDKLLNEVFQTTQRLLQGIELESDRKEFRPHLTLGKIRRARYVKTKINWPADFKLDITKITLYQSTITGSGSIYTSLKDTQLV